MSKKELQVESSVPEPTLEQIKVAIERSGYLLEQRICPIIERDGFIVTPNEQYQDQDTGKSREIDTHAIRFNPLFRNDFTDTYSTILLIECKNNSTPVVFFTQENPIPESIFGYTVLNGYPDGIWEDNTNGSISIEDFFNFNKFHHNFKVKWIARQFCILKPKIIGKGSPNEIIEWETSHENLYDSIESLTKATAYYSLELRDSIILVENTKNFISLGMIYPILLFSGLIYECRISGKHYKLIKNNHLTFYNTIQSKTLEGIYHIDIIQESFLPKFLRMVIEENDKIVSLLKRKRLLLKRNVERNFEEEEKKTKKQ